MTNMSDWKEEYLAKKYAEYDDESNVAYKRKREKRSVKKSNHKHNYENCVVVDPDKPHSFYLVSRCSICGKRNYSVIKDKRVDRKFPHIKNYHSCAGEYESEYEDFKNWCRNNYEVYNIPDFDIWDTKYI